MTSDRIARQMAFLVEADRLKTVIRRTPLMDNSRQENSAEHSWHLALAASTLAEWAPRGLDLRRVLELVVIHDLVEIDAGDTFAYDPGAQHGKQARERAAAERIFALLPDDQTELAKALWEEFEAQATPEARYANALDRLQALLQNMQAGGGSWTTYGVTRSQVFIRMAPVKDAMPELWPFIVDTVEHFCASGAIIPD